MSARPTIVSRLKRKSVQFGTDVENDGGDLVCKREKQGDVNGVRCLVERIRRKGGCVELSATAVVVVVVDGSLDV